MASWRRRHTSIQRRPPASSVWRSGRATATRDDTRRTGEPIRFPSWRRRGKNRPERWLWEQRGCGLRALDRMGAWCNSRLSTASLVHGDTDKETYAMEHRWGMAIDL